MILQRAPIQKKCSFLQLSRNTSKALNVSSIFYKVTAAFCILEFFLLRCESHGLGTISWKIIKKSIKPTVSFLDVVLFLHVSQHQFSWKHHIQPCQDVPQGSTGSRVVLTKSNWSTACTLHNYTERLKKTPKMSH